MSERYLSGVQPSGELHLGNYIGAMRHHIEAQDDAYYFIADYHALTSLRDAESLRQNVRHVAAAYLALGLDPARATFFRQSDVPEVCELTWLLSNVAAMGLLERAHSYKDKIAKGLQAKVGLFTYPILMAADILAYDSDVVPVGKDQAQHLEITRDLAIAFNALYGETFKLPRIVLGTPELVPGIDGEKMSKSYDNTLPIFTRGKALKGLVMSIKTDSKGLEEPKDPDTCTVFQLYRFVATPAEAAEMAAAYRAGGYGYGHAKIALLKKLEETFGPAYERYDALLARPDELEDRLRVGAVRAQAEARVVLARARQACGLD
ncbi:MAG: tryptophan--tRNA ligase [bacterium]